MLIRRLASQVNQLKTFLQKPLGLTPSPNNQRADLVRDKFGLDKMIVAVTTTGKVTKYFTCLLKKSNLRIFIFYFTQIFGIESKKGEIIWQSRVPGIKPFNNSNSMVLYIQRGSRHYPQPPQCSLLATDKVITNRLSIISNVNIKIFHYYHITILNQSFFWRNFKISFSLSLVCSDKLYAENISKFSID